ncbi:hypothetical protein UlMin_014446 [Ulmus minor]
MCNGISHQKFSFFSSSFLRRKNKSFQKLLPPLPITTMSSLLTSFLFREADSSLLPEPSRFFSSDLLEAPLPTNSFFQNLVLNNGDQPVFIHPYLIKSSSSSLSVSYPSLTSTSSSVHQIFSADITISAPEIPASAGGHKVCSFSDLSVTLDIPSCNLRFYLVQGSPYVTCFVSCGSVLSISSAHSIVSFSSNDSQTKFSIKLSNKQTWLLYSSSPIKMSLTNSLIACNGRIELVRLAILPESHQENEQVLDRYHLCFPIAGNAEFAGPFSLEYKWEWKGHGDLLMLAHPLHLRLLSHRDSGVTILEDFKLRSIDGDLVGVIGHSWLLKVEPFFVTWHSIKGIKQESYPEICTALVKDVEDLISKRIKGKNLYTLGKSIVRAARLALIAEEVSCLKVIGEIKKFLKSIIEPWLNGTFKGNSFCYESKWCGILTQNGSKNLKADSEFAMYNGHHSLLGYFVYGIAVLAKIDPAWGVKYKPKAYSLMADYMNWERGLSTFYPRLRCFDLYKLHSWTGGLIESADGRYQENISRAVNAYYSAALLGLAYGDIDLLATGSTLAALEIKACQMWWHIREGDTLYEEAFTRENRFVGVLWDNKRDSAPWFDPADWKERRLGIQVLPLLPITEILLSDVGFVKELVKWALPSLGRKGLEESWKARAYVIEGIYDKKSALMKIKTLKFNHFGDENSLTNLLWWIHSRDG